MEKTRRQFTPQQKVAILREHLVEHVPVSDLCDKHKLHPTLFYQWQKAFFENGAAAFESRRPAVTTLLMVCGAFAFLAFAVPIGFYMSVFGSRRLSDDPADWGVFGDFIGGSINPLLALLNVGIFVYIAIRLHDLETEREYELHDLEKDLTQLQVRPYFHLHLCRAS